MIMLSFINFGKEISKQRWTDYSLAKISSLIKIDTGYFVPSENKTHAGKLLAA